MNRQGLAFIAIVLMALGILTISYGYTYLYCPTPFGSTTGCVVIDLGILVPGVIILGAGVAIVVSLLIHREPRREQTAQ